MQVWAIGIVCLYVALGLFNWVTGLHWLAEFSLPLLVIGGVGLAIASNSTSPVLDSGSPAKAEKTPSPTPDTAAEASVSTPTHPEARSTKESSISFTINKNARP